MDNKYEYIGKLVAETFRNASGVGSKTSEIYRCSTCGSLVDGESVGVHDIWHIRLGIK